MEMKLKFPNVCDAEDIMGQMPGDECKIWKSNCLLESVGRVQEGGDRGRVGHC